MISKDREGHIFAVAKLMEKYGKENNFSSLEINELFTLGLLHDIGYEFVEEKDYRDHNVAGGGFLRNQGYKYWQEVYWHGVVDSPYKSEFLDILNWADMHIDSVGNFVSLDGRLEELSKRYNVPIDELDSKPIVDELKARGFN